MTLTKAQRELLASLDDGWQVTFTSGHYTTVKDDMAGAKLWPSTFYGLYDQKFVVRLSNGNYTISNDGKQQIRSEDK
jgi:hypothetical protein